MNLEGNIEKHCQAKWLAYNCLIILCCDDIFYEDFNEIYAIYRNDFHKIHLPLPGDIEIGLEDYMSKITAIPKLNDDFEATRFFGKAAIELAIKHDVINTSKANKARFLIALFHTKAINYKEILNFAYHPHKIKASSELPNSLKKVLKLINEKKGNPILCG